jgi:NAD(P)H-flavin reductase/hemoglobin-like flavoprotein
VDTAGLKASWARVEQLGEQAPALFYAILFALAPELRGMFPVAMSGQRDKLLAALGHIVSHIGDERTLADFASQLGRDHRRFDVLPHHYPIVGRALLGTLERALGTAWTPQLAADWAAAYQKLADLMVEAAEHAAVTYPPWWDAQVVEVQRRCAQISVFTIWPRLPYPYLPGQSTAVETALRPRVWRYLSPANSPRPDGTLEFHVKAIPGGQVSPALTYQLQPGDTVKLGAPIGTALTGYFASPRNLLLVGGGTGLAPMRAIVEQLASGGQSRRVTLVVGADTATELYDRDALASLDACLPWLSVVPAVRNDPSWGGHRGSAVQVALRLGDWSAHDIYLCGPPAMVGDSTTALETAGYAPGQIFAEAFSNNTYPPVTGVRTARHEARTAS